MEDPAQPTIQSEADDSETTSSVVIDRFHFGNPGAPISGVYQGSPDTGHNALGDHIWSPFRSKNDWDIAYWAKKHSLTSSAITEFLAIPVRTENIIDLLFSTNALWSLWKVVQRLDLSYRTTKELNDTIDDLPGRPPFVCEEVTIGDEHLKFYYRDILASVRTLYGDPTFQHDLIFAPERHFTDDERKCRVYNEMHTGDWWWSVQVRQKVLNIFGT